MAADIFQCKNINIIVYVLVALFGIGSWVDINGLWVELPVMVPHLPEGWKLPSYLSVIIQMANIGPLLVTAMYVFCKSYMKERVAVYAVLGIGATSCLLLSFFWQETTYIAGGFHSTALLVLQFFLALTDCTTSVLFLPFMATFKAEYMTGYFIGEGLSGLVPSIVALTQGVGQLTCKNISSLNSTTNVTSYSIQPIYHSIRFSVEEFFYFLCAMLVISIVSFTILNYTSYCKKEKVKHQDDYEEVESSTDNQMMSSYELNPDQAFSISAQNFENNSNEFINPSALSSRNQLMKKNKQLDIDSKSVDIIQFREILSTKLFIYYLVLTAWVNCLSNGALPSLQTYSTLPFGNDAYHLSATLANIANPLACMVAFFITVKSSIVISVLTFLGTAIAGYIISLAVESPNPVLYNTTAGSVIVIAAWILVVFILTFIKVSIAGIFREEGKKALLWIGGISQVGSAIGAIVTFVLVNVYEMFESAPTCPS
ncbi:solute carrier family 52, riboflavin transporter, member 3-B-like isoform X1 [Mytilus californianus]|uniref:solute carrier family 52, riboflavin transporter, member 3-B-like isoform X1 n=1 Tax=Mytilus californianus TaxID=6549 RepID=UPI00224784A6|nr:solute carrier family 52, riboflavin transporter, member 3-B-like isoform X1 [Mytilus californianus]